MDRTLIYVISFLVVFGIAECTGDFGINPKKENEKIIEFDAPAPLVIKAIKKVEFDNTSYVTISDSNGILYSISTHPKDKYKDLAEAICASSKPGDTLVR